MAVTKIKSKWIAGLLSFFKASDGTEVFKITESGIESPDIKGPVTGNVTGILTGGVVGGLALSKADNYALAAADKKNIVLAIALTAGSKTVTLGLAAAQVLFVYNAGDTNAFTLKNVSGDSGTLLAAGKIALVIGSATANASVVVELN